MDPTALQNVRVIKLAKPGDGQAQTVYLGYDQKFKIDLSGIASEKITFVHVGERLVILFDNKSTLTIDPFFNSSGAPRNNIAFDVNGREIDGSQFAATFPITTDQSVLPAAGDAAGGTPASGANFRNASVDPFAIAESARSAWAGRARQLCHQRDHRLAAGRRSCRGRRRFGRPVGRRREPG